MATGEALDLPDEVGVVNVGLPLFAAAVAEQGRPSVHVDWRIPAGGDPRMVAALRRLCGPRTSQVDAANAEAVRRLDTGVPMLVGVRPAGEVVPPLGSGHVLLHPGPAIELGQVCDPLRRSMRVTILAERWCDTIEAADALLESGAVTLLPANDVGVVVPMASVVGASTPVWVIELDADGESLTAYAPVGQGSGDVAWFGRETSAAYERLMLLREAVAPVLSAVVADSGPVDVLSLAAQAVAMGDDVHVRTQAATNLLFRHLLPSLVGTGHPRAVEVARLITSMARNGTQFGAKLPGNDQWFLAPAPMVGRALYHPGRGAADGAPDIGDSALLELVGLGGAAAAGSPAVASLVGGAAEAAALTAELERVCVARSTRFTMPTYGGRGTPLGVDVRKVVEHGITPKVTTGILHVSDGSGQIGAGVAEAPIGCFRDAMLDLDARLAR